MIVEVDGVKSTPTFFVVWSPTGMYPIFAVFSLFINDLCSCICFSKFDFYAYDLQIYLSGDIIKPSQHRDYHFVLCV
jgi:hypothetical protein